MAQYELSGSQQLEQLLQMECSICLGQLNNPHLTDCGCGYSFCRDCISNIRSRTCPLCKCSFRITVANKRLERALLEVQVHCSYRNEGCKWVGKSSSLKEHLNLSPSVGTLLIGCGFVELLCRYCNESFCRGDLEKHHQECIHRPLTCEYCGHMSSYQEMKSHWSLCERYPIPCTNSCGEEVARYCLNEHLAKDCSMRVVDCSFAIVGCKAKLVHKYMKDHLLEEAGMHFLLQNEVHEKKLRDLQEKVEQQAKKHAEEVNSLRTELGKSNEKILSLERRMAELSQTKIKEEQFYKYDSIKKEMTVVRFKLESKSEKQAVGEVRRQIDKVGRDVVRIKALLKDKHWLLD